MKLGSYDLTFQVVVLKPSESTQRCLEATSIQKELWLLIKRFIPKLYYYWHYERARKLEAVQRRKEKESMGFKTFDFNSFFDTSLGKTISHRDDFKQAEKQGMVMMSPSEAKRYYHQAKLRKEKEARENWRKQMRPKVRELLRGAPVERVIRSKDLAD